MVVPSTTTDGSNSGTVDGPIKVITSAGSAFSTANFLMPPPDCAPVTGNEHARSHHVEAEEEREGQWGRQLDRDPPFTDCVKSVPVKIQRKPK